MDSGFVYLIDSVFRENSATESGAAIGTVSSCLEAHGCRFERNNGFFGATINTNGGTVSFTNSYFDGNSAVNGIHV